MFANERPSSPIRLPLAAAGKTPRMWMTIALAATMGGLMYVYLRFRMRRGGVDERWRRWRALPRERRRRISRAVREGRALADVEDAQYAVALVDHSHAVRGFLQFRSPWKRTALHLCLAALILAPVVHDWRGLIASLPLIVLVLVPHFVRLLTRGRRERMEEARRLNEQVVSAAQPSARTSASRLRAPARTASSRGSSS